MGRLDPRVPRADHDHIIISKMVSYKSFLIYSPLFLFRRKAQS